MRQIHFLRKKRSYLWSAAVVVASLWTMLLGENVYGNSARREHHHWTEIIQLWDGQYLKIGQHSSQREYNPLLSGDSDPWHVTHFTVGNKEYRWEGAYIPIVIQPDESGVYIAVYDRETPGESSRFRLYRNRDAAAWDEIDPKDFPKHLAIQNTWLSEDNGILPDHTVLNEYDLVEKMDPAQAWFRRSFTAQLWTYLEDPSFRVGGEGKESSLREYKAKWIKTPGGGSSQGPRAKLTRIQRGWNFEATITENTETIRKKPNNAEALCNRGYTYALENYNEKALADFNQAIRINPNNFDAYRGRATVYRHQADLDKAIVDYDESIRLGAESVMTSLSYGGRGLTYEMRGDHDRALADLNEAIRLYSNNAKAFYARGLVGLHKGNLDKAIADLTEALRLNPVDEEAYYSRGLAHEKQGKKAEAEKDLEQASRLGYKPK